MSVYVCVCVCVCGGGGGGIRQARRVIIAKKNALKKFKRTFERGYYLNFKVKRFSTSNTVVKHKI